MNVTPFYRAENRTWREVRILAPAPELERAETTQTRLLCPQRLCCRKGDPFQGPKLGSRLTLGNELSEETHADKAGDFIGKGHPGGEQ